MATLLGIRGANPDDAWKRSGSAPDAYGLLDADSWALTGTYLDGQGVQMHMLQIIMAAKGGVAGPTLVEVSFDETDILETWWTPGHPGVVALFLASSTPTGTTFAPPGLSNPLDNITGYVSDLTPYVVPAPYLPA